MALPLLLGLGLGAGLLTGGAHLRNSLMTRFEEDQQKRDGAQMGRLLGKPGEAPYDGIGPDSPGSGLLADPTDPANQLTFAAGMMSNQRLAGAGGSMLNNILGQFWQNQRQDKTLAQTAEIAGLKRSQGQTHHEQRLEQQFLLKEMEMSQRREENELKRQQAIWFERQKNPFFGTGSYPSGNDGVLEFYGRDEQGAPIMRRRALPQSKDWIEADTKVAGTTKLIADARRLAAEVTDKGEQFWNADAQAMQAQMGMIVSHVRELQGLGVINGPGELEFIQNQLPDPTQPFDFKSKAMIVSALETLAGFGDRELELQNDRYSGWGLPSFKSHSEGRSTARTPRLPPPPSAEDKLETLNQGGGNFQVVEPRAARSRPARQRRAGRPR